MTSGGTKELADGGNTVAYDLAVLFNALEQRGPFHEVRHIEVEVVVLGQGVEVAEVEVQKVRGADAADRRHDGRKDGSEWRVPRRWGGMLSCHHVVLLLSLALFAGEFWRGR